MIFQPDPISDQAGKVCWTINMPFTYTDCPVGPMPLLPLSILAAHFP